MYPDVCLIRADSNIIITSQSSSESPDMLWLSVKNR